jgi:hypothetical protein
MIPAQGNELFESGWKTVYIVWTCIFMSLICYLLVGIYSAETINIPMDKNSFEMMRNVFYGLSFIILIATKLIKNHLLSDKGLKSKPVQQQPGQNPQDTAIARYLIVMMISLALSEAVAIFGLILVFTGKNTYDLYFLIIISALAMIYHRPIKDEALSLSDTKLF